MRILAEPVGEEIRGMRRLLGGLGLALVALLVWGVTSAYAAPHSDTQDPAQLSTAAALFVKVDPASGTDTIVVVNRQQAGSATTTGSAISVRVRFYDADCNLRFDNNVSVTPQGIFTALASSLFGVSEPGVVLADFADPDPLNPVKNSKFALSGVVVDANFGALYERQGAPLLARFTSGPDSGIPLWGGFTLTDASLDDWFIGGFTMLQMICPGTPDDGEFGTDLASDMNALAVVGGRPADATFFAFGFDVVNVYDAKEVLKRSIHNVPCFCNTDSAFFGKDSRFKGYPGDFVDVIASMKAAGVGTFHWAPQNNSLLAWRVIGDGKSVWWSAPLRRTPGSRGK